MAHNPYSTKKPIGNRVAGKTPLESMDKVRWRQRALGVLKRLDLQLCLALIMLAFLGGMIMYSSGFDHGTRFSSHMRNFVLALIIMVGLAQIPSQRFMYGAVPFYVVGVLLLLAVALFGIEKKGAQRWVNIGVVFQPSEIMKIAVPLMLAWWFQLREGEIRIVDFVVAAVLLVIPVAFILKQPDLGTSLLVLSSGLFVIYFAGLSWKLILPPFVLGVVGLALIVWFGDDICVPDLDWQVLKAYQKQRVCTLLDPYKDPLGKGFHIIQGMIAIGSGGIWGKGWMQGTQTHLEFIPERTTDFIFAAYSEEFGLVGNVALIVTFTFLILRGLYIAAHAPTLFTRLLAGALSLIFFDYAFVNIGMVSGILPVVGVPLPFVSYGGTAMITLGVALGILMSISNYTRNAPS